MSRCAPGVPSSASMDAKPSASFASNRLSSIHALSCLLRGADGKQELKSGKDFKDNCGLLKSFSANRASSKGGLLTTLGFHGLVFGRVFGVATLLAAATACTQSSGFVATRRKNLLLERRFPREVVAEMEFEKEIREQRHLKSEQRLDAME